MNLKNFFAELKRRNVFTIGLAQIQVRTGAPREGLMTLRRLLAIPAGIPVARQRLKLGRVRDPIRNDPEFPLRAEKVSGSCAASNETRRAAFSLSTRR